MSTVNETETYNNIAAQYDSIESLPIATLYHQQTDYALPADCTGKIVLDLGGGTGLHARKAIERGATFVDNVDISPKMLELGESIYLWHLDRPSDQINWLLGDITKPIDYLPLQKEGYDIVMVNWTFDHAESMQELETMWENVSNFCKSGGLLISIRMCNPWAKTEGRYGVTFSNQVAIPGGCQYLYTCHANPQFSAEATTMEASWDFEKSKDLAERFGFTDFAKVPEEEMETIRENFEFWRLHLEDPSFICITARKL